MKWRTVQTVDTPLLEEAKAALKFARSPIIRALADWRTQAEKLEAEWASPDRADETPGPLSEYRAHTDKNGVVTIQFREVERESK